MSCPDKSHGFWSDRRIAWALGGLAGLAVILTLADPGITVDEPLDVRPGRKYVETLRKEGLSFFGRGTVDRIFRDNAEHPPLGRWLLGLASTIGEPLEVMALGGPDPLGAYVVAGRMAPALAFAALVGLVASEAGRRYGRAGAVGTGFALIAMPRVFAHAHLGALDTFVGLFWTWSLMRAARVVDEGPSTRGMVGAGGVWGLALLTKIQAWLLPPIVLVWALTRLRPGKALASVAIWAATGLAVFAAGWPWLWYDSWARLSAYLATGVHRTPIRVLYFGRVYLDREVPWHYPWVYFAVTVPVGLHAIGALGLLRGRRDPFAILLAATIAVILALFSTKAPVYDGERLFLVVFPLWALLIGRGFSSAWGPHVNPPLEGIPPVGPTSVGRSSDIRPLSPTEVGPTDFHPSRPTEVGPDGRARPSATRRDRMVRAGLAAFLIAQGYGVVAFHPFGLSYYNALVGGLPGAERLGLELTYWGDAVDPILLDALRRGARPGETAAMAPTLAPGQGAFATPRDLLHRGVVLRDQEAVKAADWIAVYRRTAYWPPGLEDELARLRPVAERRRQGVRLSAIYRRGAPEASGPAKSSRSH